MRSNRPWWILLPATVLACQGEPDGGVSDADIDDRVVVQSTVSPPPISGGTLLVMDEGETAVAADPDRDLVHVIDMRAGHEKHGIALHEGDEPGRLVADAEGRVHVVARRGGVIVDLDPKAGTVLGRRAVCANPRGIVYDGELDRLHVACAGGDLVTLPATGGSVSRRVHLAPDLRDVVLTDEGLVVTEPFHWQGDLPDMAALVDEVHVGRMGGRPLAVDMLARTRPGLAPSAEQRSS